LKEQIYYCPECHKDIALGRLISLKVICPYCMELIIIDAQDGLRAVGNPVSKRNSKKTYGYDKLTIKQMHSNRAEALDAGHSHYFTGQLCRNGHIAPRNKRGECHECTRIWIKNYVKTNRDRVMETQRKHREKKQGKAARRPKEISSGKNK